MDDDYTSPRSLQSELVAYIKFINRTQQIVDLFWLDYAGTWVKYGTLQPGGQYAVDTFVTHPWIFRDAETGYPLRADGQEVFYPQPWNPEHSSRCEEIFISLSVYTLKDMCKLVVSRHYSPERLQKLSPELPADILLELLHGDATVPYQVSQYYQV